MNGKKKSDVVTNDDVFRLSGHAVLRFVSAKNKVELRTVGEL